MANDFLIKKDVLEILDTYLTFFSVRPQRISSKKFLLLIQQRVEIEKEPEDTFYYFNTVNYRFQKKEN